MSKTPKKTARADKRHIVHRHELPLSCPTPQVALWSAHPKVYLPIETTGTEVCPYCSTRFVLHDD